MSEYEECCHHGHHRHHHGGHHRRHGGAYCRGWGEGGPASGRFRRRFFNREERIASLEQYLRDLQAEAKGVEEELARLREAS
jgi:hypothetical protein